MDETNKKVMTRTIEHQQDRIKENWESACAEEHYLKCDGHFYWLHPKTSGQVRHKSRKVRESLQNKRSKCDNSKSDTNHDNVANKFVKTN